MSRIGRLPIPVPSGVDVAIDGQAVSVKGPKGALSLTVAEPISVAQEDGQLKSPGRTTRDRSARCTDCPGRSSPTW
jgi:large subunit ribosomal protein L6